MIVEELIVALGFDVRGEGELRKFDQHIDRAERRAKTFTATLGRLAIAAGGAIAAFGASRALSGFITDITRTNAAFEQMEVRLKSLEGSAAGAKKAMDFIGDFADRNAADIMEAADAYARLRTFGIDPTTGSLQAVYDAASATGGGLQQLNGITLALGQAWSKQKLQGEEILQLVERGIPVWDLLADATGKNVPALQKLSEAGKLGRREIQLLIDAMGRRFLGQTAEFAKSWDGIITSLISGWKLFQRAIGESGYFDDIKGRVRRLKDTFDRWRRDGTTERLARGISDALQGVLSFGDRAFQSMSRFGHALYFAANGIVALTAKITGLSKEWAAIGLGAAAVGSTAFGRTILLMLARRFPMLAAFLAVDDILAGLGGEKSIIGSTKGGQAAIDRLKKRFADAKEAADELAGSINGLFGVEVREGESQADALGRAFKEFVKKEYVQFIEDLAKALEHVAIGLRWVKDALAGIGEERPFTGIKSDLGDIATSLQRISDIANGMPDWLRKYFGGEGVLGMQPGGMLGGFTRWWQERWSTPNDKRSGWGDWFGGDSIDLPEITVTPDQESLRSQEETTGEVRKNTESTGSRLDAIKEKLGDLLNFFALTGEATAAINPGAAVYGGGAGGSSGAYTGSPAHGAAGARSLGSARELATGRARALLDLIGRTEGTDKGDGYNETLGYGAYTGGDVNLVGKTLDEIDALQTRMLRHPNNRFNSSAVGRYQIVRTTMRRLRRQMGLDGSEKFSAEMQDRMATELARGRGLDRWLSGDMSDSAIMNNLAREWASLPKASGGGAYRGQRAATSPGAVMAALREVRDNKGGPGPSANDNMAAALKAAGDGVWWLGQNGRTMQGHMDRTSPAGAASRAQNSVTQASQVLNQTINATVNQTVQQAMDAPKAAAQATSDAIAGASRKTPVLARRQVNPGAAP